MQQQAPVEAAAAAAAAMIPLGVPYVADGTLVRGPLGGPSAPVFVLVLYHEKQCSV